MLLKYPCGIANDLIVKGGIANDPTFLDHAIQEPTRPFFFFFFTTSKKNSKILIQEHCFQWILRQTVTFLC